MKFSIVIPVFKTEHLLKRCLDSFAAQTDGDFEVIVVDDASPSAESKAKIGTTCSEIVAQYDSRFKYVRHEKNLSLLQARQTGLRSACGEFVIPFDSDDFAAEGLVAALRREWMENPAADVVAYQRMAVVGMRKPTPELKYRNARMSGRDALDFVFNSKLQCAIGGKAVRRTLYSEMFKRLGIGPDFYLNSSEDLFQTFALLALAKGVSIIDYPGYFYWLNPDSLTNTLTDPARIGTATEQASRVFSVLERFVLNDLHDAELAARLERHKARTLVWYIACFQHESADVWRGCAAEMCRHFEPALVAQAAADQVRSTRTYRLGAMLTALPKILLGRVKGGAA